MDTRYYMAVIGPSGDGGYGVVFPDFPGCVTVGDTVEEAQGNAIEALCLHVEGMIEDGEALPEPSRIDVSLPDWLDPQDVEGAVRMLVPIEIGGKAVRVNITMDDGLLARLDRVASVRGVSRSGALGDAARKWIQIG